MERGRENKIAKVNKGERVKEGVRGRKGKRVKDREGENE